MDADASAASGADAADGGGAARRGGAPPKAKRVVKPLTRAKLEDFQAAQENRGVCYFSRIPPYLNVHACPSYYPHNVKTATPSPPPASSSSSAADSLTGAAAATAVRLAHDANQLAWRTPAAARPSHSSSQF